MKNLEFADNESLWCEDGRLDRVCRVSMLVSTYNLEKSAPLAVRSALAQNYSNYEVVIVDDASTDLSWQNVIETVREYKGFKGVRVKCLRNKTNLGIAGTFNRLMSESCGEICLWQCGDDVAYLDRVSKIVECWDAAKVSHPDLVSVTTEAHRVGRLEARDFIGSKNRPDFTVCSGYEFFDRRMPWLGAAAAYSREQYDFFGPIDPESHAEDLAMRIRMMFRGSVLFIHEPLLEYHCIGGSSTSYRKSNLVSVRKSTMRIFRSYLQAMKDLSRCKELIPDERYEVYERFFGWMVHRQDVCLRMMSDSFRERFAAIVPWIGVVRREKSALFWIAFVLPRGIADCICLARCFVGNINRKVKTIFGRG